MSQIGQLRGPGGGGGGGGIDTITGDSGGPVGPDGFNNINIRGDGSTIIVAGNAGTNLLTISATGNVAIDFDTDDGNTATPALNILVVRGSTNINTEAPAPGNVVQINLNNSILLPATIDQDNGVIALGADLTNDRFMHNFGVFNTFLGTQSGNFTLAGGQSNTGIGYTSLTALTSGTSNVGLGLESLESLTSGDINTAIGTTALQNLVTGDANVALGALAAFNYTTNESSNIIIHNPGVVGDNNTIRIGAQGSGVGQQDATYIAGIYDTAFGATNRVVFIDNQGKLGSSKGDNGEIIIGSTAGSPAWSNITSSDLSIIITNGANTIDMVVANGPFRFTVTTNNAVATPIATIAVFANSAITVTATIVGARDDFSASLWGELIFGARRAGGATTAVQSPINTAVGAESGATISADVSGNDLRVLVTGVAAQTWNWTALVSVVDQS